MKTLVFYEPTDLEAGSQVTFEPHQPQKHPSPVVRGDLPDEHDRIGFYGTVVRDPWTGRFRMWYTSYHPRYYARYAESDDGLSWSKPVVHDPRWIAHDCPNAVMPGQFPVVMIDREAEEEIDRYRLFIWDGMMNLYRSGDGTRWERHPARWNPVWPIEAGEGLGEVPIPFWDPHRREYIAMTRLWVGPHPRANERSWDAERREYVRPGGMSVRMVGRGSSPDGIFWTGPDIVYNCDNLDPLGSQPYEFAAWPYADRHLGLLGIFHSGRNPDRAIANTLRLYLAWSTDGCYTWSRLPDRLFEFVPLGPEGSWDGGMITQPTRLVEVGDEWWCYYGGHAHRHVATEDAPRDGIGLATMPKGRLISITGTATTRQVKPGIGEFWVNGDAGSGRVVVTVDGDGVLPEGPSDPVVGNGVRLLVTWNERQWMPSPDAPPVRIHLTIDHGARLWECGWG